MNRTRCPVCGSLEYDYASFSEGHWGPVEQHGYCDRCGYTVEQAYSPIFEGFNDIKHGYKDCLGVYHNKNHKRHLRVRRKHLDRTKKLRVYYNLPF